MARRRKSLLSTMLSPPKRRPARRRTAVPALPGFPALPAARTPPVVKPGGRGSWTEHLHVGPAGGRGYVLYVPPGLSRTTPAPLLMLLHGCTQTPAEFAAATRFNALADRNGVVLVYPQQTVVHNLNRCWNWFDPRHQSRLAGEPAILVGLVHALLGDPRLALDPERVLVAGISAGGGMAMTLGATHPDVFAGVGVHSGPPFKSASGGRDALAGMAGRTALPTLGEIPARELGLPPTIIVQGTLDHTVRPVAADRLAAQWLEVSNAAHGSGDPRRVVRSRTTSATTGTRTADVTRWYTTRGRVVLESWLVGGLGHAWSGGQAKGSFSDPAGPRATTQMWRFLSQQRLGR